MTRSRHPTGEPTYYEITVWEAAAEHAAESLRRGDRVIFAGFVHTEVYEVQGTCASRTSSPTPRSVRPTAGQRLDRPLQAVRELARLGTWSPRMMTDEPDEGWTDE